MFSQLTRWSGQYASIKHLGSEANIHSDQKAFNILNTPDSLASAQEIRVVLPSHTSHPSNTFDKL